MILMELSDQLPGDQILTVLLVFCVIYFLVPLVTACALFSSLGSPRRVVVAFHALWRCLAFISNRFAFVSIFNR